MYFYSYCKFLKFEFKFFQYRFIIFYIFNNFFWFYKFYLWLIFFFCKYFLVIVLLNDLKNGDFKKYVDFNVDFLNEIVNLIIF